MIALLLLTSALSGEAHARPCLPLPATGRRPTPSAIEEHRALRTALHEPMPKAATMVLLHGKGGHLATREYSIVVARGGDGAWRGTAVGRSQIWIKDAPYSPMERAAWTLDKAKARQLDQAIARRCPRTAAESAPTAPPQLGVANEVIDVVTPSGAPITFYVTDQDGALAELIRPPQ